MFRGSGLFRVGGSLREYYARTWGGQARSRHENPTNHYSSASGEYRHDRYDKHEDSLEQRGADVKFGLEEDG